MKQLQQSIQSYATKSEKIDKLADELNNEIQKGSAQHFINWHNSKATASNRISESWVAEYEKHCAG